MKWAVYRWAYEDIVDEANYIIHKKGWYEIGTYNSLEVASNIVQHEIQLYNCTCEDNTPLPKFKIETIE